MGSIRPLIQALRETLSEEDWEVVVELEPPEGEPRFLSEKRRRRPRRRLKRRKFRRARKSRGARRARTKRFRRRR